MSHILAKRVHRYLLRAVILNYITRLLSVLFFLAFILGLGVLVGGKWALAAAPYGHPVTLFHVGEGLAILGLLVIFAWPKLAHPETVEEMAVRLERHDSELNECLTSALQFLRPDPLLAQCLEISTGILPAFFEDTVRRVSARKRWYRVVPWYFWFSSSLCIIFVLFWVNLARFGPVTGDDVWNAYREYFLVNPYRPLHTLIVEPGFSQVLRGDSVKVRANLLGPGTHEATIQYSMSGFPQETAEMKPIAMGLNVFEFEFENLQSDLTYQIQAGPLTSLEYTITVKDPPELTYIQLTYFFPEFTGRNVEAMPAGQGAARAPMGTTVEVSTRWNKPMARVFLSINEGEKIPFEKRGEYWKQRFVVENMGRYVLSGTSEEGVPTREGLEFPIEVVNDTPPAIEWVWPKEDLDLSDKKDLTARIPLVYRVEDDYGIESIYLYAGAPGRATKSYEIANLDGKSLKFRQTYDFPIKSWGNVPVVRVYLMANDNHPGIQNQTPTEVRRFYLRPPGTFDESEEATDELKVKTDPFELTAIELFYLIKTQRSQNATFNEKIKPASEGEWFGVQEQQIRMTSRTVLRLKDRVAQVRYSHAGKDNEPQAAIVGVPSASGEESGKNQGVSDLATRLEEVISRLAGSFERLDQLTPGNVPDGNSALDHELRQLDAAKKGRARRSREEGERALRELEAAFRELTGKKPPRSFEEAEKEKEEEEKKQEETSDEEDEKKKAKTEEDESEEFEFGEGDNEIVKGLDGEKGETGVGEEKEEKKELGGASLPTNVYSPSQYTLDPDTVTLDTPASRLLRRVVAENLSGLDLSDYRKQPIPPEYRQVVEEYNKALLGDQ